MIRLVSMAAALAALAPGCVGSGYHTVQGCKKPAGTDLEAVRLDRCLLRKPAVPDGRTIEGYQLMTDPAVIAETFDCRGQVALDDKVIVLFGEGGSSGTHRVAWAVETADEVMLGMTYTAAGCSGARQIERPMFVAVPKTDKPIRTCTAWSTRRTGGCSRYAGN